MTKKVSGKKRVIKPKHVKVGKPDTKQGKSVVSCFVYSNKGKGEVDSVTISLNGKNEVKQALSEFKLDILSLNVSDLVKQFFIALNVGTLSGVRYGYKNAYQTAFGLVEVRPSSYKCVIANHASDGLATLVFNQSKSFNFDSLKDKLTQAGLSFIPKSTYAYVTLSKDNLPKVVKVSLDLLKVKQG